MATLSDARQQHSQSGAVIDLAVVRFRTLALGLAALGLFGLLSYTVARRTADFGIRIALGASQRVVLRGVLRESLLWSFAGIMLGLVLMLALSGAIRVRAVRSESARRRDFDCRRRRAAGMAGIAR